MSKTSFLKLSTGRKTMMKKDCGFASIGGSVRPMTRCEEPCASTAGSSRDPKMRLINVLFLRTISEIKLKRTDTTLDLSQKAKRAKEKKKKLQEGWVFGGLYSARPA